MAKSDVSSSAVFCIGLTNDPPIASSFVKVIRQLVFGDVAVALLFNLRGKSQVAPSVIASIAIDVINGHFWRDLIACHPHIGKASGEPLGALQSDLPAAILAGCSYFDAIAGKLPGFGVVVNQQPDFTLSPRENSGAIHSRYVAV